MAKQAGAVLLVILALVLALGAVVVPAGPVRAQAMFSLEYLTVNPQQAHPGQPVNISINVANTGGTLGMYTVVLKIDGQQEEMRNVWVEPLRTYPVNFLVTRDVPGTYTVTRKSTEQLYHRWRWRWHHWLACERRADCHHASGPADYRHSGSVNSPLCLVDTSEKPKGSR